MNNCFLFTVDCKLTKDLPKYGIMEVLLPETTSNLNTIPGVRHTAFKAKVSQADGYFLCNGQTYQEIYEIGGHAVKFVKNATGQPAKIEVDFTKSEACFGVMNLDNLIGSYLVTALTVSQGYIDGDTSKNIYSSGSIDEIGDLLPNLTYFLMTYMPAVTGSIKSFAKCLGMGKIDIHNSTGITGSLEELAAAQVALGRASGTLTIICNGVVTYNGAAVANSTTKTITYSGSGYVIS